MTKNEIQEEIYFHAMYQFHLDTVRWAADLIGKDVEWYESSTVTELVTGGDATSRKVIYWALWFILAG
jgi:hypothetical protein